MTVQIEVRPETAMKLQAAARLLNLSVADYLERITAFLLQPLNEHMEDSGETIGQRLERKGLLGIIDSSLPPDPDSPPRRGPLFDLIADKLGKQGLTIP